MMNLVSRCSERTPDVLASTASEGLVKTRQESQSSLSAQAEMYDRTMKPVVCLQGEAHTFHHERHRLVEKAHLSSYSEWNVDKTWSSQEWKSDVLMEDRTVRLVNEQSPGLFTEHTDWFVNKLATSVTKWTRACDT